MPEQRRHDVSPSSSLLKVTQAEVLDFSNWSGDRNPIHVDAEAAKNSAFGSTIVHGALSTIVALRSMREGTGSQEYLKALDIQFRGEIRPGQEYRVDLSTSMDMLAVTVLGGDQEQLTIRAERSTAEQTSEMAIPVACDWASQARHSGIISSINDNPIDWKTSDFRAGSTVIGTHRFGTHQANNKSRLTTTQERVLGLCSFIVGMKAPGLSSLFTRLQVRFTSEEAINDELIYRLRFRNYEPYFRMLETELEVASIDGRLLALAELQSYVRFPVVEAMPENYVDSLRKAAQKLSGKVVLVCGASRGLGAEIAAAFGAAKCHVYIACRHPNDAVMALVNKIRACGATSEIIAGDVSSSEWCANARQRILAEHGRLDALVLNACEPPKLVALTGIEPELSRNYISNNIALSQVPLISFLPSIVASQGTVVAISSSAVVEFPLGFGDYVAVKLALEGAIKTASNEYPQSKFLIARPGKLRTSWNDSPARAIGVIPPAVVANKLVESLVSNWDRANLKIEDQFEFDESEEFVDKNWRQVELVLCASFTLDPFDESLEHWSKELHWNIQAAHAPYAQVLQETLNPSSILAKSTGGSVILLRVSDWLRELSEEKLGDQEAVHTMLQSLADEHVEAIKLHRTFATGPTLLIFCPSSDFGSFSAEGFNELQRRMQSALFGTSGLTVLDATDFHHRYEVPENAIFDRLREDIAHIPFQNAYYHFLATLIVRFFHRSQSKPKKVVVLDCDNTLWRGVVGEAGPEGVIFDEIHHQLHKRLNQLSESGILLCLCSKNEEHDVWSVFETRKDFGLRREVIVAASVNWLPKSENIRGLSETLNLGLDSFIFIDDNPVECAEVRSGCPNVLTIQWPLDATAASGLLDHLWELDVYTTTAEDRKRTQMYREEFQRQQIQSSSRSFQDFIDSLQLKIDVEPLTLEVVPRASQLTLRTNQFNLTTVRRTETELIQLLSDSRYECRTVKVSDRFGDYGLVGFFIAFGDEVWLDVDSFMLSCRVLGRGVEHRMAVELGKIAMARGLSKVRFRHIPTERNKPARLFLTKLAGNEIPSDQTVACEFVSDAALLTETTFQAESTDQQVDETKEASPQATVDTTLDRPRQRESQINRIASELSTYALLSSAFGDAAQALAEDESTEDVAAVVKSTFAKSLRLSEQQVCKIDRLESMGCDSLRIVEITVALTRQFSWLPKTLLFEHRSVSEIIDAITQLRSGAKNADALVAAGPKTLPSNDRDVKEIAIVGMGVKCAGGESPIDLWHFLAQGRSAVRPVPAKRDSFVGQLKDVRSHYAGLVDGVADFDCTFFGISPREAEYMDPQLRLMLQTTWQALEDAGSTGNEFDKTTGVFVGAMYSCYGRFANQVATQTGSIYRCWESFSLANRLSQVLGCNGPSLSIDTACSSSATALHYACESLKRGDCTTAVVSGVNLIVDPDRLVQFTKLGILSPSGKCVPFGDEADGTVLGEGVVTLVLRPMSEAKRRGDRVYAVIKGTGVSVGAGSVGFTAPNPVAQATAVQRAIADAQVDARTITYIETHGTGTELGDPIELRGLELAYCNNQYWSEAAIAHSCAIGSIKPNVGHLEAGAGLMGVMKAALQLYHRMRLPSTTSKALNPKIDFSQLPFYVQQSLEFWPATQFKQSGRLLEAPRRAGVNSFGVGGSNVHVIMEEFPRNESAESSKQDVRSVNLLVLSAESESALRLQAAAWESYLGNHSPDNLSDACYSAVVGRKQFPIRTAVVIEDRDEAIKALKQIQTSTHIKHTNSQTADSNLEGSIGPRTAFLFTGQGAQYPGMFKELYRSSQIFHDAFNECNHCLDGLLPISIREIVFGDHRDDKEHPIHQTQYTQPALFSAQYALYQLWSSWGILGDVFMGHSIGEIAAYCVAGGCSLEDAAKLVAARGRLMQQLPAGGTMCAIPLAASLVRPALDEFENNVSIAAFNGPKQTVISGERQAIETIAQRLSTEYSIKPSMLAVSHAFHSALMEPMLAEFEAVLKTLNLGVPEKDIVSSALAKVVSLEMAQPKYWLDQARNPVLFTDAMAELSKQGVTHFVEIGPHPVMLSMGRQCLDQSGIKWLPSARRGNSDWSVVLNSLGEMFVDGAEVDWKGFYSGHSKTRLQVPCYQFDTSRIWLEQLESIDSHQLVQNDTTSNTNRTHLAYELNWCEESGSEAPIAQGDQSKWLVVSDQLEALREATDALSQKGILCSSLILDLDSVSRNRGVSLPPTAYVAKSTYELTEFIGDLRSFDRVIYVDSADFNLHASAESVHENASHKCYQLSQLIASIAKVANDRPRILWCITTRAVSTVHQNTNLTASPLWGLGRVAALEFPTCWGGLVDIENWNLQATAIVREIVRPSNEDQVALKSKNRFVPRIQRTSNKVQANGIDIDEILAKGSVLITGGLGGIGLHLAKWLTSQGAKRIVLVSRKGTPSELAGQQLQEIRDAGVDVVVIKSDIATPEGIKSCMSAFDCSPLVGIFHAAGLDLERPLAETTRAEVESIFDAKVKGAWLLHQASVSAGVKFFVCLSSISSIWGSSGRSTYAAANAFLDELTYFRRSQGLPSLVVNLGPIAGGGMANAFALEQLSRIGNFGLQPQKVLDLVKNLLESNVAQSIIADVDWTRLRPILEARRARPILGELGHESRLQADHAPNSLGNWSEQLVSSPVNERRTKLLSLLQSEVAVTLRIKDPSSISVDRNLFEIGMESIAATEFAVRIQKQSGLRCAKLLSENPTISRMSDALLQQLASSPFATDIPTGLQPGGWIEKLKSKPSSELKAELVSKLRGELSATLRIHDATRIDTGKSFSEIGLDSLAAVDFATRVRSLMNLSHMPKVLEHQNIERLAEYLAENLPVDKASDIVNFNESLRIPIATFCEKAWPERPKKSHFARWEWMFLKSAQRLSIESKLWLYRDNDQIVGHMGAQHVRLKIGDVERNTAYLVETMVLESHRELGVGATIMLQAKEDMPFCLSLGQTAQMRVILEKLGWSYVGPLPIFLFPINAARVLRNKLPRGMASVGAGLLRLRVTSRKLLSKVPNQVVSAKSIDHFDQKYDTLWQRVSHCYGNAVVRDASYLNWKYVDQPGQNFVRLEICRQEEVIGCVVLAYIPPDKTYSYSRVNIVEMVTSTGADELWAVIHAAVVHCRSQLKADAVIMQVINPSIEMALDRYGFLKREATRHLMVSLDGDKTSELLLDASRWLITQGDSDIDRPTQS